MNAKSLTPSERAQAIGRRLSRAIVFAGLDGRKFAQKMDISLSKIDAWRFGECEPFFVDMAQAAALLNVDARWLATGESSPTAREALTQFERAISRLRVSSVPFDGDRPTDICSAIREALLMTPQPFGHPCTCRYCGFRDPEACEGGKWVDADSTICSSCLQGNDR